MLVNFVQNKVNLVISRDPYMGNKFLIASQ